MKKGKLYAVLGTVLLSTTLLAACGADKAKEDTPASSSAKTEETTKSSAAEVVSTASISDKADVLEKALSADGNWIIATTGDVTFDKDVTVAGEFHDKGDKSEAIYRKLALYDQDKDYKVTAEYTITVPKLIVESENFNIVHGTVKGNIEVKANGFVLDGTKVEGNITFATQEAKDTAKLNENGASVTGEVTVAK